LFFVEREGADKAVLDAKKLLNTKPPGDPTTLQKVAG
jgi:hypothetical protein